MQTVQQKLERKEFLADYSKMLYDKENYEIEDLHKKFAFYKKYGIKDIITDKDRNITLRITAGIKSSADRVKLSNTVRLIREMLGTFTNLSFENGLYEVTFRKES